MHCTLLLFLRGRNKACLVFVDPKQPSHSVCSLSAGFDFTGYTGDIRNRKVLGPVPPTTCL